MPPLLHFCAFHVIHHGENENEESHDLKDELEKDDESIKMKQMNYVFCLQKQILPR